MGPLLNGSNYNAGTLKIQFIYKQEKNKLQHVVMVPVLKLGPCSNQWAQINRGVGTKCRNLVASAIVVYVLGPKTKTSILGLKPSTMRCPIILGPNLQKPIRSWAQKTSSSQSGIGPKPHHVLGPKHVRVGPNDRLWAQPPLANQMWVQLG